MEFMKGLQQELRQLGLNIEVDEKPLEISHADIVKLNNEISNMTKNNGIMLASSPYKAARFACSV